MKLKYLLLLAPLILATCRKKDKNKEPEQPADPFDKQALLVNMADQIILPNYLDLKASLDSLTSAYNTFKVSGTLADFQIVKQKLRSACLKYQRVSPYELGPAETLIVRMNFNVFPTDSAQIKYNIGNGNYNLDAVSNLDAKGFPALDYLFYGKNQSEASVIQGFTSNARKQYVSDLLNDMTAKLNAVIDGWNTSYRSVFVSSLSSDVGSPIGLLVNQLNFELDYLKNSKVGIPLGKKSLGTPLPEKCEAYFEGQSMIYAKETLLAIENMYLGRSVSGNDGKGFDDYLSHLKATYHGGSLDEAIKNQFSIAKAKLAAIPDPLSQQVSANPAVVDAAYTELVKLLVLLKTDMPSSLGVIITYQDGDGD